MIVDFFSIANVGDVFRLFNLFFGTLVVSAVVIRLTHTWGPMTPEVRLRNMVIIGFAAAGSYGSAESIAQNIPSAPRTFVVTVTLFWAALAEVLSYRKKRATR